MEFADRQKILSDLRRRHGDMGRLMDEIEGSPWPGEPDMRRMHEIARDIEYTLKKLRGRNYFL
ncbi:MAG: hypothetical protein MOGMAGMI_00078 [Candidatus Omnitrophica bacterium]|nr:hypothetical protein [Candidatus Omnitrophota bacterium]